MTSGGQLKETGLLTESRTFINGLSDSDRVNRTDMWCIYSFLAQNRQVNIRLMVWNRTYGKFSNTLRLVRQMMQN